jgi:WD40 repeat protein
LATLQSTLKSYSGQSANQQIVVQKAESSTISSIEVPERISLSLGVTEAPESDFDLFNDLKMPDSCTWITSEKGFADWLADESSSPSILWVNGPPGSGKSILATFAVAQLREMDKPCQFYYFRYEEREKRSPAALLRSLIFQMASCLPQYCTKLLKLAERGNFSKAESRVLWQKVLIGILEKVSLPEPIYWVIDALDECDSPQSIFALLSGLSNSTIPIRILITGRVQPLEQHFERLAKSVPIFKVSSSSEASRSDLRRFVEQEMEFVHCDPDYKPHVTQLLLRKANGNFLWSRLVLNAVQDRFDEESIAAALEELPSQLGELYYRMESTLVGSYKDPADKRFAIASLSWIALAQRQLSLKELSQALQPEYPAANLAHRVSRLCGEFISVDKHDNISMVHHTAREFLTTTIGLTLSIDPLQGHLHLFSKCMSVLMDPGLKIRLETSSDMAFVCYAAVSWSHHLSRSCAHEDQKFLTMLVEFLRGPSALTWIYMLATWGKLRILVSASKYLLLFVQRRIKRDYTESPLSESFQAQAFLESWAIDLVKLVAKFGTHLSRYPDSIFTLVPAFCPSETAIHKQFGNSGTISISGLARPSWDDYLAKFSVGRDTQALGILCSDRRFATLTASYVTIWYADTCEEACKIRHGERVLHMKFSVNGDMLVICGFRTTKVWELSTTQQLYSFQNPQDTLPMDVAFSDNDAKILTFSDDGAIRSVLLTLDTEWQLVARSLGDGVLDSRYGSPKLVAFHPEGTQIAIAYRGVPVLVWNLTPLKFLGKCKRPGEKDSTQFWADVNALDWNPITGHVVGAYNDGCLFKWHPMEPVSEEVTTTAALVCCSPDGNLMAASSTNGTIRVWNFHTFALLYQLSCSSQSAAIALSPDSRRIYDIRESTCNVWQPNTLVRLAEADEKASDSSSASLGSVQASEATAQLLEPITALGASQHCSNFFTGDDEGVLKLINIQDGESRDLSNCWITVRLAPGFPPCLTICDTFNVLTLANTDFEFYCSYHTSFAAKTDLAW